MRRVYSKDERGRTYYELDEAQRKLIDIYRPERPICNTTFVIDMTEIDSLRKEGKAPFSLYSFILKAAADTLANFPILGGRWEGKDKIICSPQGEADIGGPIQVGDTIGFFWIERANQRSLTEISEILKQNLSLARSGGETWVDRDEKTPGMVVSNVGTIGEVEWGSGPVASFSTSILGICAVIEKTKVIEGQIQIRKLMNAVLLWDHRAMMANTGVEFLTQFKRGLENPLLLWEELSRP